MANTSNMTKEQIQEIRNAFENIMVQIESGEYQVDNILVENESNDINSFRIRATPSSRYNKTPQNAWYFENGRGGMFNIETNLYGTKIETKELKLLGDGQFAQVSK